MTITHAVPSVAASSRSPCACLAEEGDIRLVDELQIENWKTGRLEVFFEGSWSQVCSGVFDVRDANVACHQLGLGGGTIVPQALSNSDIGDLQSTPVFPEVAITASGCTGSEERLVDCGQELGFSPEKDYYIDYTFGRDCVSTMGAGLRIACVESTSEGTHMFTLQIVDGHVYDDHIPLVDTLRL